MTLPMRPYAMGYGYGTGQVQEEDYFGPQNPGHQLAQAVYAARGAKRADEQAAALEDERKAQAAWRTHQQAREDAWDPISMAIARSHLVGQGIRGPGQGGGGGGSGVQHVLPSAGIMAGSRSQPIGGVGTGRSVDPGFTAPNIGNRTQSMDSGFLGPRGMSPLDRLDRDSGFTAHDLPGAFNPATGQHNPADIDLGGGYSMSGAYTPEGRRQTDITGLQGFGFSPEEALYLSNHPEHMAPFLAARERGRAGSHDPYGPEALQYHQRLRDYEVAHPLHDEMPHGGLTMEQAIQEALAMRGSGSDVVNAPGRDYLRARTMYYGPGGEGYRGRSPVAPSQRSAPPPPASPKGPASAPADRLTAQRAEYDDLARRFGADSTRKRLGPRP